MTAEPYAHLAAKHGYLRADFRLMTTAEGGRNHPLGIGDYRANWSIHTPDPQNIGGAPLTTDNSEGIGLGETTAVRLFPIWPEFWDAVEVGAALFAFEGAKLVGTAVVTDVVPPDATSGGPA